MEIIYHQLCKNDLYIPTWEVEYLFLGTFNPTGGKNVRYYYGRPKNQTWKLLSEIFRIDFNPNNIDDLITKLKVCKIGCIDMINSVNTPNDRIERITGKGYSDSEIINNVVKRDYNTVKILEFIESNSIKKVFSTWGRGSSLADWRNETNKIEGIISLVSPSLVARVPEGVNKYEYMLNDWREKIEYVC